MEGSEQKIKSSSKAFQPYVLILCIAVLIEIFGFNYLSYKTLFVKEKMLGDFSSWVESDESLGISSLFIKVDGEKIYSVFLDAGLLDPGSGVIENVSVSIAIQDIDKNEPLSYVVTDYMIYPDSEVSKYIFFTAKDGADQIRIDYPLQEGKSLRMYEVKLNAHRPLFFVWWRFLIVLVVGLLMWKIITYVVLRKNENEKSEASDQAS